MEVIRLSKTAAIFFLIIITAISFVGCSWFREPVEQEIKLYFPDQEAQFLIPENRIVKTDELYYNVLSELFSGPEDENLSVSIPPGVEVEEINIQGGRAEVSFSRELIDNHWGGSTGERMTVYSIVNTLTQFDEIDTVQILIEGQVVETLAGHMDLTISFGFLEDIVQKD